MQGLKKKKKKNQHTAKMWFIHPTCFPLQLIRKLYYRKVEVAFLSKANVPTSEKWERGMPRADTSSFPSCSPLGLLTLARLPGVQFVREGASACTWAMRRHCPGRKDLRPHRNHKARAPHPASQSAACPQQGMQMLWPRSPLLGKELVTAPPSEVVGGAGMSEAGSGAPGLGRPGLRGTCTSGQFREQTRRILVGVHPVIQAGRLWDSPGFQQFEPLPSSSMEHGWPCGPAVPA